MRTWMLFKPMIPQSDWERERERSVKMLKNLIFNEKLWGMKFLISLFTMSYYLNEVYFIMKAISKKKS